MNDKTIGRIHSIETCGTVDGPGIRYVVFMQGCPLRCQYCHNPDTWDPKKGKSITIDELIKDILKYKSYMNFSGGGVTISGGEPLLQSEFVLKLLIECKKNNIHTALDTSGFVFNDTVTSILDYVDLVLLDIKNYDPKQYKVITGVELAPSLRFLDLLEERNIATWIRYVLVPNLSDNYENIEELSKFLQPKNNIEKIELLPFHKMGEYKWEELGIKYSLTATPEPSVSQVEKATSILRKYNSAKI